MNATTDYDVLIVGAGIAGLIAANRAAQLGLRTLVLEQGNDDLYLCNTRYTGGTFHVALRDIMLDAELLTKRILDSSAGFIKPELAALIAHEGRRVIKWLQDEGLRFMRASASEHHRWVLAPPGRARAGLDWEGRGGDVLLRTLEARLRERQAQLLRGTRATGLLFENERCVGLDAEHAGIARRYTAHAVFIADGGFPGNAELVSQHICTHADRLKQRGAGTGRGDGIRMASAVGAALIGLDRFYGHTLSKDAFTNDRLWPYPYLDSLVCAGITVDGGGRRFVDEGRGGVYVANAVAQLDDPLSSLVIFDAAIWEKAGRHGLIPANPHLEKEGATIHRAPTLNALAAAANLPAAALQTTVQTYNESLRESLHAAQRDPLHTQPVPTDLNPPRTTSVHSASPIVQAPFFAVPMCAGITHTMGGIRINEHAQALRADGTPIAGLYALGAATGGLEGGPEVAYVGGLVKGGVTALVAAEHVAASPS